MGDWFRGSSDGPGLKLSNGATAVFLDELPWSTNWENERGFLLRVIGLARSRFGWELLSYEPPKVDVYLAEYERLVQDFRPSAAAFARCPRHGLFLGDYTDCRLCL